MIKKIIFYFTICTLSLYGLRWFHYKGLLKQNQGYYAKYKTCFDSVNKYGVIFLGSSRAEMHYNTRLFDSLTGSNSFNLSMAGASPEVAYAMLKIYLHKSRAPKLIFYEVDLHNLKNNASEIYRFNNFFPFLSDSYLRSCFNRIDPRMQHFYYNPYYSFAYTGIENLSTSLHGWLELSAQTDHLYYKGHLSDTLHKNLKYQAVKKEYAYLATNRRHYLDSLVSLCQSNKVQLILISSPIFAGGSLDLFNKQQMVNQLSNFAKLHCIGYYDLSSLSFCQRRELFIDHHHLNAQGSRIFTSYLVDFFSNKTGKVSLNYLN